MYFGDELRGENSPCASQLMDWPGEGRPTGAVGGGQGLSGGPPVTPGPPDVRLPAPGRFGASSPQVIEPRQSKESVRGRHSPEEDREKREIQEEERKDIQRAKGVKLFLTEEERVGGK